MAGSTENTTLVHDARSGFHDITAPPVFGHPSFPWTIAAAGAALLFVIGLLWRHYRRQRPSEQDTLTPCERGLERLGSVKSRLLAREVDARDAALALSMIVREFLDELVPLEAQNKSSREIGSDLPGLLQSQFRSLAAPKVNQLRDEISMALCTLDKYCFAPDVRDELLPTVESIEDGLKRWWEALERARLHSASVIEQGAQN